MTRSIGQAGISCDRLVACGFFSFSEATLRKCEALLSPQSTLAIQVDGMFMLEILFVDAFNYIVCLIVWHKSC